MPLGTLAIPISFGSSQRKCSLKILFREALSFSLLPSHMCVNAEVVHTGNSMLSRRVLVANFIQDISSNNFLQGIHDDSILPLLEQDESDDPGARKNMSDRTIYISRPMPTCTGLPVLCNLGEARLGNCKHREDIMPGIYRAPEMISEMEWDFKVDMFGQLA